MPALAHKHNDIEYEAVLSHRHRRNASTRNAEGPAKWRNKKPYPRVGARQEHSASDAAPGETFSQDENIEELLSHFGGVPIGNKHDKQPQAQSANKRSPSKSGARRRALERRAHRPFRLTLIATILVGAPLALLASLLWLRSSALAMARQDEKLQKQISAARFDLERSRKEIAALNASPHIEEWAKARGWKSATQNDFDAVGSSATNRINALDQSDVRANENGEDMAR